MARANDFAEEWKLRVEASAEALRRTRYAFLALTIVSCAIIVAEYNTSVSWYVHFATRPAYTGTDINKTAQEELTRAWVKSKRVTVSLLGVDFGSSDAGVLGSLGLYVLTSWFFYTMRRENHLIGGLLIDAHGHKTPGLHRYIFHGIVSYLVFTTVTHKDTPIDQLRPDKADEDAKPVFATRAIFLTLIRLPAITIGIIVLADVVTLLLRSTMRDPKTRLFEQLTPIEWVHAAIMIGMALVVGTLTLNLCSTIIAFEKATGKILRQYLAECVSADVIPEEAGN